LYLVLSYLDLHLLDLILVLALHELRMLASALQPVSAKMAKKKTHQEK
jgi:hypothetical protein